MDTELSRVRSGKDILPELHTKTHFKGASTLLTDTREINSCYNDAKLRSRFKTLEKNVSKSRIPKQQSLSIDIRRHPVKGSLYMFERDSSIQHDSRSNLIVFDDKTNRSMVHDVNKSRTDNKSKVQMKSILKLSKHVNSRSKDLNFDLASNKDENDYGLFKGPSVTTKHKIFAKSNLCNYKTASKPKLLDDFSSKKFIAAPKHVKARSKTIIVKTDEDSEESDEEPHSRQLNDNVDISGVTRYVLTQ